ncbi:MAG: helix-turn-helix domain-containing protein, partial [Pseudomonadota bacterium]
AVRRANHLTDEEAIAQSDALIALLSEVLEVPGDMLRSPSRCSKDIALSRQIGMYLAHTSIRLTMAQVGLGFQRGKSTVVHACHLVEDMREDATFDAFLARLERIIEIVQGARWYGHGS